MSWTLIDHNRDNQREFSSKSEAEEAKSNLLGLGASSDDLELVPPNTSSDGGQTLEQQYKDDESVEVVDHTQSNPPQPTQEELPEPAVQDIPMDQDPLDILPAYMIDTVKGTPTLNKRGLSVLAFHYGVDVVDRRLLTSPHDSDWEYAIVETTVQNSKGNQFVGTGTAHVDRGDDKGVLLELAETRSYKRAVSFATGTGIVSYQEMIGEME